MKKLILALLLVFGVSFAHATYPHTDAFTGSGSLGSGWTCGSNAGSTLSKSSGIVTASGPSYAACYDNTQTYTFFGVSNMYASTVASSTGGDNSGPCLLDGSGNGYCWFTNQKVISIMSGYYPSGGSGYICGFPSAGQTVKLSKEGSTIGCTVGTGAIATFTDSSVSPTHPGIGSYSGYTITQPFTADCYSSTGSFSCGSLPSPSPSVTPNPGNSPVLANFPGITVTLPTSSVGCYRTDGVTPTVTTPGTCPAGSTTYTSGTISLAQGSGGSTATTNIIMLATSATYSVTSAAVTWQYVLSGVIMQANIPSVGQVPMMVGGDVWLNVSILNGSLNTVTAAISGNYGGATGTLDSTAAGNSIRHLTVTGATTPACIAKPNYPRMSAVITTGPGIDHWALYDGGSGMAPSTTYTISVSSTTDGVGTMTTNSSGVVVSTTVTTPGTGFTPGATINPYYTNFPNLTTFSSNAGFNVVFTSVDDGTVSKTIPIIICQKATYIDVLPFSANVWSNQPIELSQITTGNPDITGTWSIPSQPSGGDGVLDYNPNASVACIATHTCLNTLFKASVAGRYKVQYANADGTTAYSTINVSTSTQPRALQPNGVIPIDPTADPYCAAHGGTIYEIGPTQTYHSLDAVMTTGSVSTVFSPCATLRIHNEGANGSPTTYHEWIQMTTLGATTQDTPFRIVGVPNASGELPVIDGTNATGPVWGSTSGIISGLINSWVPGCGGPAGTWPQGPSGSCGPNWVVIEGLSLQNVRGTVNYYPPGGGAATPWPQGTAAIPVHVGYGTVIRGNQMKNDNMAAGSYTPKNNLPWSITQDLYFGFNKAELYGDNTGLDHGVYFQSADQVIEANNFASCYSGDNGSGIKTRSYNSIIKYNFIAACSSLGRLIDQVDIEDAHPAYGLDDFYCPYSDCTNPWVYQGDLSFISGGFAPSLAVMAGFQAAARVNNFVVGNVLQGSGSAITSHYNGDNYAGSSTVMKGTLHWIANSVSNNLILFDASGGGTTPFSGLEFPYFDMQGNITDIGSAAFSVVYRNGEGLGNFGKNLFRAGSVNITSPVNTCGVNVGNCGWWDYQPPGPPFLWQNLNPITSHATNIDSSHFLFTPTSSTVPFDSNLVPVSGGGAVGAGTTITGLAAKMPQLQQFNVASGTLSPRSKFPADLGAVDSSGASPTVVSVAITPSPVTVAVSGTAAATCTATMSDSSTQDCTTSGTWSTVSANFTVGASTGIVTGVTISTGNALSVTYSSVTGTGSVTVTSSSPSLRSSFGSGKSSGAGTFH